MLPTEQVCDNLNSMLRGELSATETYQQAMAKVGLDQGADELRRIHDEHREAANTIRMHIHEHGGMPDQDSGAWGAWAKAIEGSAKIFGNLAALKALKEGEKIGVRDYEKALAQEDLPDDCKTLIRTSLLPRTRTHIPVLDQLMSVQ